MHVIFLLLSAIAIMTVAGHNDLDWDCGRYQRCCGHKAHCDGDTLRCECNEGYEGCPLVECHKPEKFQCVMKADPHLVGYELAKANLNWPCKYRLTRVQHPLRGGVPGLSFCSFEVFGYNEVANGKYYTDAVEISLSVVDSANQFFTQQEFLKFDFTSAGVRTSDGFTVWGSETHSSWQGVDISCEFDEFKRFAIFSVPQCHFTVKFRPRNPSQTGAQSRMPSISIVTGANTVFGATELGMYPESLCGQTAEQGDNMDLYENSAAALGLDSRHLALLYAAINQTNVIQQSSPIGYTSEVIQDAAQCTASRVLFDSCTDALRADAINLCARLLTSLAKCAGIRALEAFNGCLEAKCVAKSLGCPKIRAVITTTSCEAAPIEVHRYCTT